MIPPRGFKQEVFPLRHRLLHGFGLAMNSDAKNTALLPLIMASKDMASDDPETIVVNPHNANYVEDGGPLVRMHSIIDRLTISLKFSMTHLCGATHWTSGNSDTAPVFEGDDIPLFNFWWRPMFNVYPEKLDAADDDTGTTVAAILGLTKDATNEDVVPLTTNKLSTSGPTSLVLPMSSVNDVQVFGDYNMTTNTTMEDHVYDDDLMQTALRRYTNKGALRSCVGRTRHVTLTRSKPYKNFYIDKPVPRAIRRVQKYGFFAIQIHMPIGGHVSQHFQSATATAGAVQLGVKMISNFHEWNAEHLQDMGVPS